MGICYYIPIMTWKFKYGMTVTECTSFPFAFRTMWNTVRKELEKGQNQNDMIRKMSIVAPIKDRNGDPKTYSYTEAVSMAQSSGLLTPEGLINGKEFKR